MVSSGPSVTDTSRDTSQKADSTGRGRAKHSAPDSAILLAEASQPNHRSMADSISLVASIRAGLRSTKWPVTGPAPLPGSLLPQRRIVAFYGNPLSKRMGVLGEYPQPEMLAKLDGVVAEWRQADPTTPVQPALHLNRVRRTGPAGKRQHVPAAVRHGLIEKVYGWAKSKNALLFLDIQTGKSTVDSEMPRLIPFLSRPDVHLGLDPEFNMHHNREGRAPGSKIGAMHASEVNYAIDQLAQLVTKYRCRPRC